MNFIFAYPYIGVKSSASHTWLVKQNYTREEKLWIKKCKTMPRQAEPFTDSD